MKKNVDLKIPKVIQLPSGSFTTKVMINGERYTITKPTAEECAAMRARGVQPWAGAFVKDAETVARAVACDVDLITTDYPDIVLTELRKLGRHP